MTLRNYWSLNKLLILILTAGFVMLVVDLRFEHVDVVRKHSAAWILIVYSGLMIILGGAGLSRWIEAADRCYRRLSLPHLLSEHLASGSIPMDTFFRRLRQCWKHGLNPFTTRRASAARSACVSGLGPLGCACMRPALSTGVGYKLSHAVSHAFRSTSSASGPWPLRSSILPSMEMRAS